MSSVMRPSTPNGTRILNREDVARHIDIETVVNAVEEAFSAHYRGDAQMPAKSYVHLPDVNGDFRSMPATLGDSAGVKWVNVHPENPSRFGLPTVMGLVIYSDPESAYPLSVMDGTELTRYRTGAAAGVATRFLASPDAVSLGLLGAGEQARTQLAAIDTVLDIETVVVSDLDPNSVDEFINSVSHYDIEVTYGSPQDVANCEVISTTTPSKTPIIESDWLSPGTHINAIGADAAGKQELDPDILKRGTVIVDDWDQCSHSGEINVPVSNGQFTNADVFSTLGAITADEQEPSRSEITVFDSTGLAIQDIATAKQVYDAAAEADAGTLVDIIRHD